MAFTTLFSNRVEILSERLMAGMQSPLHDPLTPEYVLVDNLVMGQWLNLQLAQQQGIAANIRYIQPHELFWLLARAVVSHAIPKETPLSKEEMTWKLFGLLGDEALLVLDAIQPVKNYLAGASSQQLKRYQLAASVADLFDQYLVYRPDMLLRWENDEKFCDSEACQRELWRRLSGVQHRALIEEKLLEKLATENVASVQAAIPMQRLFVFGITSMPPHFVRMLMLLGKHIDVQLFAVNPCREYWFDIASAKSLVKKQDKRQLAEGVIGNPLLASQGTQVKEFIESLYGAMDQFPFVDEELYRDAFDTSLLRNHLLHDGLLHSIQQEILQLSYQNSVASLAMQESAPEKMPLPDSERQKTVNSIRIHNCHSPLREVEVLHDQLLALFKQDATLKPRDVVVMMPQVAPYVPYIETVFGNTAAVLPYHITDRSWLEEVPLLNTLDLLLTLPESRLPLTDILAMLEVPAVQIKFGLDRDSFEKLKRWLQESGARWGLDAAHREQQGLPAYSEFSWEFGINRMLAGFSMMATQHDGVAEPVMLAHDNLAVLPYDEIEGGASAVLDGFLQFWETLLFYRKALAQSATPAAWAALLLNLLDDFFDPQTDEEQLALRDIRRHVNGLRKAAQWFGDAIDLSVVRAVIQPALQAPVSGGHPWREGVKFCSLMPMRGVPFRVIYMLGMNQSDYPKRAVQQSFDLMRNNYRAGDRSRRVDDRWLFLEALLSARDVFHVSYIGRDQRKNETREPSVVVAELMDYLRHGYCLPDTDDKDGNKLLQALTTVHPLQPFNPAYFFKNGEKLFSFNRQAYAIASGKKTGVKTELSPASLWQESTRAEEKISVSLDSFVRFFAHPSQWFLQDRHAASLRMQDESITDADVFELNGGLAMWAAKEALRQLADSIAPDESATRLSATRLADVLDALEQQWRAEGKWPLGAGGDSLREKLADEVDVPWLNARHDLAGEPFSYSDAFEFDTARGVLEIHGEVNGIGNTLFFHRASKNSQKYTLDFSIRTAFAGMLDQTPVQESSAVFYGSAIKIIDVPARQNRILLQALAELYMQYREGGLPFAPDLLDKLKKKPEIDISQWPLDIHKAWEGADYSSDKYNSDGLSGDLQAVAYYMTEARLLDAACIEATQQIAAVMACWNSENEGAQT